MEKSFNLIKNSESEVERRVFPRFPLSTMTFKSSTNSMFEVVDLSDSGMQIRKRNGGHTFKASEKLTGEIHWKGNRLECAGIVKWIGNNRLGMKFNINDEFIQKIGQFLSVDNIVKNLRPLHLSGSLENDLPIDLSCWLQADGPMEFFVWSHLDGEVKKIQIILFQKLLEWNDGSGIIEGNIIENRDKETPLTSQSEATIKIGNVFNESDFTLINNIISKVPDHFIKDKYRKIIKRILS